MGAILAREADLIVQGLGEVRARHSLFGHGDPQQPN
jgi:hypothetical protein